MKNIPTLFLYDLLALNCFLAFGLQAMETPRSTSPQKHKQITFVNNTEQSLDIIFNRGTLPITLSTKLPEGATIPPECQRKNQEPHPLVKYTSIGRTLIKIPDAIRKNFSYGITLSSKPKLQTIYLGIIHNGQRMLRDFRSATQFHVKTPHAISAEEQRKSGFIEIENETTYRIHYNNQKLIVEKISPETTT